jgi:hypothetical protein
METAQAVTVQGTEGKLFRGGLNAPDAAVVTWEKNGYGFIASTHQVGDYGLQEFLAILEAVS